MEHFDAVIIGRDLSGLVCATLLAKRKYRVRLLRPHAPPTAPDPTPLFGLQTSPVLSRVLDEVGLVHATRTRLEGSPRPVTLALPDRRLTLEPEAAARGQALGAAFPGRSDGLVQLFDRIEGYGASLEPLLDGTLEIPPDGFSARRAYRKTLGALPAQQLTRDAPAWSDDPALRELTAAMLAAAGRFDDVDAPITAGAVRALWHLCHGVAPFRDGQESLRAMLLEKLQTFGGDVCGPSPARSVEVKRRRFDAVVCGDDARYGADVLIYADDAPTWAALVGETAGDAPSGRQMRVSVALSDRPVDLLDPCGWRSADAGPCLVRVDPLGLELRWMGGPAPDVMRLTPLAPLEAGVPRPTSLPGGEPVDPLGLARAPIRGPLKNMCQAGEAVLPGLGLEGPFLTALLASAAAERMLPRKRRTAAR